MKKLVVLSLMMFLTFMVFPVWFIPMFPYVGSLPDGGKWAFWCGLLMGIGTFASPLIGMFADRYLHAERVLCLCFVLSGLFLCAAFFATSAAVLFWFLLGAVCFYMPTWALTFTILVLHAPPKHFPWMRSLGTAGWVAAGGFSAVAAGCDGLLIEVHPDPPHAMSDVSQQLNFSEFSALAEKIRRAEEFRRSL